MAHLTGETVRLIALTSEIDIDVLKQWLTHAAAWRLLDEAGGSLAPKRVARGAGSVCFLIYPQDGGRPIGHVGLFNIHRPSREAWLGLGLGRPEFWANGYGAEALQLALGYAFDELDLQRVWIGVFDYQANAIRSYEQAGFAIAGRLLQEATREPMKAGLYMGLGREAWLRQLDTPRQAGET